DHAALNRVARGTQTVSVWKDSRELGKSAVNVATMLAEGTAMAEIPGAVQWSGGPNGVDLSAIFLAPIPITQDNLDVVIDAGWISKDKVCEGAAETVSACE
ncbi:MAG: D-xylose ABC transporter substrate-binding protein, partial [Granulosicoccus sp.]|nr:D-xylose ABC transporter substrate-binding protein [Granulosicoccus sp.]